MGNRKSQAKLLMVGLDAAGKTTVIFNLKLGEVVTTIPTIGFNVETVEYKNFLFHIWDVGGKDKIRHLLERHYYENTTLMIFVVDSNDSERLSEAREELHRMLSEDLLRGVDLLVLANKQDLPLSMSADEVADHLALHSLKGHRWGIQPSVAKTKEGIYEGLDWACKLQANAITYQGPRIPSESLGVICEPGHVVAKAKLLVFEEPCSIKRKGTIEIDTHLDVLELCLPDNYHALAYGRIEEPISGWISLHSSHVLAPMFVVTIHCTALNTTQGGIGISCCNIGGEEIASFQLDHVQLKTQTMAEFRQQLGKLVRKDMTCLKLVLPSGKLLDPIQDNALLVDALDDADDKREQKMEAAEVDVAARVQCCVC